MNCNKRTTVWSFFGFPENDFEYPANPAPAGRYNNTRMRAANACAGVVSSLVLTGVLLIVVMLVTK